MPDYKKFKDNIERWKINLLQHVGSGFKHSKWIRRKGYFDNFGSKETSKIERAMRTLDDKKFDMRGKLKNLSEGISSAVKEELPQSVRIREACYFTLISEIARQKHLLSAKKRNEKAVSLQADAVMRALNRLISADNDVAKDHDELRITQGKIEELKAEREKVITPESDKAVKAVKYVNYGVYGGAVIADFAADTGKDISDSFLKHGEIKGGWFIYVLIGHKPV